MDAAPKPSTAPVPAPSPPQLNREESYRMEEYRKYLDYLIAQAGISTAAPPDPSYRPSVEVVRAFLGR